MKQLVIRVSEIFNSADCNYTFSHTYPHHLSAGESVKEKHYNYNIIRKLTSYFCFVKFFSQRGLFPYYSEIFYSTLYHCKPACSCSLSLRYIRDLNRELTTTALNFLANHFFMDTNFLLRIRMEHLATLDPDPVTIISLSLLNL